jgi:hypothetical protein
MSINAKSRRGEMMVELLVSISIVVVSLLGIFSLVSRALGLNRVNSEQYIATYLAAEGIELSKNIFDQGFLTAMPGSKEFYSAAGFAGLAEAADNVYQLNFDSKVFQPVCSLTGEPTEGAVRQLFKSGCGSLLQFDATTGAYGYALSGGVPTKFKRLIIIDAPSEYSLAEPLEFRVTSAVGWDSRGGSYVVQLQDHFLPWRIP